MLDVLRDLGHEASCFAYYGLDGGSIEWNGFPIYPPGLDQYGNDALEGHLVESQADALITLFDPFVCIEDIYKGLKVPWLAWVPVDSDGLAKGFDVLNHAKYVIALSHHGEQQLIKGGIDQDKVMLIPHGVDCQLFRNRTEEERAAIRDSLGLPSDCFLVGMIQANKGSRKAIDVQIEAFARFQEKNDDVHLYLHVEPSTAMGGVDIEHCLRESGLLGKGVVHRTSDYHARVGVGEPTIAGIMGGFDVLLQATCGEGFGIPIIEAQASGVPVIVNDCSAMPELARHQELICRNPARFRAPHGGWHFMPQVDEIVRCLEHVYKQSWNRIQEMRDDCTRFAQLNFDWPVIQTKWKAVLTLLEAEGGLWPLPQTSSSSDTSPEPPKPILPTTLSTT
jgi:glycosyltransferase involved in cell wall biosynthesis